MAVKKIIFMLSFICFFMAIFTRSIRGMLIAFIIGIVWAYILFINKKKFIVEWVQVVSGVLSFFLVFYVAKSFILIFQNSNRIQEVTKMMNTNKGILLLILCCFFVIISLILLYVILKIIINWIRIVIIEIKFEEIIKELFQISLKSVGQNFFKAIMLVILSAGIGTALLVLVWSIPLERVEDNIMSTAYLMEEEGVYPRLSKLCTSQLDNFTDAIMFLESSDNTKDSMIHRAMLSYRDTYTDSRYPYESLIRKYVNGEEAERVITYPRYWHGYLVFIKPLLTIIDYSGIRTLNGIIQILFVIVTVILMVKRKLNYYIIPYILSYLMLMPLALAKSLQFSSCFYVFSICSILFLVFYKKEKNNWIIFLFAGILTAYFDFLTYPVATFGMVIVIYLILGEELSVEKTIVHIIKYGISWAFGYGVMWASKWIIASVTTDENVIANAIDAFLGRTSNVTADGATNISVFSVETINIVTFLYTPVSILVMAFIIYYIYRIAKKLSIENISINSIMLPYILVAFAPIVWYVFAMNHSYIHYWFTNKACVVAVFSIMCMLVNIDLKLGEISDKEKNKVIKTS